MDLLSFLLDIFQMLLDFVIQVLQLLVQLIEYIFNVQNPFIMAAFGYNLGVFKLLLLALWHMVSDLLHGHFLQFWKDYLEFRKLLRAFLKPALDYWARVRKLWHDLYRTYLAPVLNLIQDVRKVLVIFRIMHLKWATTLDKYLGQIEGKLIGAYQTVLASINRHADFLYLLTDPLGFLRIVPLLHSVALAAEDIVRLFTGRTMGFWYDETSTGLEGTLPTISVHQFIGDVSRQVNSGTGDAAAWSQTFTQMGAAITAELGS